MPSITINGVRCEFSPGQMILQVANDHGVAIPQYCYHDGLSIVASCRICLAEGWAPNARTGALEPFMGGKLFPTCQTPAADGMVIHTDSPKSVANQKSVMEYLLINHPLDCPVCDQAGECLLQDFSYQYGRGVSRFEESKVKQPKKDLGPHVLLYADRCILCSRCVRFTREVTGTAELIVQGRGDKSEIDVFPGNPIDNDLSANVIDLCPVGALLDKDFLFAQRVWFLKSTPSIDPITASGDNIWVEHNEGRIYRLKPRVNLAVNHWWITDEVRYGWKFVHSDARLRSPMRRQFGALVESDYTRAYDEALRALHEGARDARTALVVSPMLPCEEAFVLAELALAIDPEAILAVGPIPIRGEDKTFPVSRPANSAGGLGAAAAVPAPAVRPPEPFKLYAEKCPNSRGVRRVLECFGRPVLSCEQLMSRLGSGGAERIGAVLMTGNYPGPWADDALLGAFDRARDPGARPFLVLIDTLWSELADRADVVLPGATWAEKAGTFQNARGMLQAFEQAIPIIELAKSEGQIALDLLAARAGAPARRGTAPTIADARTWEQVPATQQIAPPRAALYNAADVRAHMAGRCPGLGAFATEVRTPGAERRREGDMAIVDL